MPKTLLSTRLTMGTWARFDIASHDGHRQPLPGGANSVEHGLVGMRRQAFSRQVIVEQLKIRRAVAVRHQSTSGLYATDLLGAESMWNAHGLAYVGHCCPTYTAIMLARSPQTARKRQLTRARQKRWQARQKAGGAVLSVAVADYNALVGLLLDIGALGEDESLDRRRVEAALAATLDELLAHR